MTEQRTSAGFRDVPQFQIVREEDLVDRPSREEDVELAKAAREVLIDLAITPGGRVGDASPLGKGPRRLSDYEREIAHALIRKGKSKRQAIKMARGLLKKAAATGRWGDKGKASGPVRAGARASIAQRKTF